MANCPVVSFSEELTDLQWEESIALQESIAANREARGLLDRHLRGEDGVHTMDVQIAQIGAKLAGRRWKAVREVMRTLAEAA